MPATEEALIHARVAALAALEKLGSDVIAIDVSDHLAITDLFVVVTGRNEPQVNAIVDEVEKKLLEVGEKPLRREGAREGRWVLLDYGDIIVHVQHFEERGFYDLERLWNDCPIVHFEDATPIDDVGNLNG